MVESDGKGARVTGFFVFQVGAGVVLDSGAHTLGMMIALSGAALIGWGFMQASRHHRDRVLNTTSEQP